MMKDIKPENGIDDVLLRCLEGTSNEAEYDRAWQWVSQSPENRAYYRTMFHTLVASNLINPVDATTQKRVWARLENEISQKLKQTLAMDAVDERTAKQTPAMNAVDERTAKRTPAMDTVDERTAKRTRLLMLNIRRLVAAVVIGFALGIGLYYAVTANKTEQVAFVENIVPLGSKSEIVLPDGSRVWLNAGSTLRYPTNYGKTTRDLYLEGEGYFKVAKQAKKPFTVYTALSNIRALGTEFNVKAYPDETVEETTLIKGEVVVEKGDAGDIIKLIPGQKLVIPSHDNTTKETEKSQLETNQVDTETTAHETLPVQPKPVISHLSPEMANAEISWKERNWRIESESLQSLSVKIERRYDVTIHVDDRLKNYRFTGTIKDESLEQVLHAMQLSAPILFKVEGKNVFITVDPKK